VSVRGSVEVHRFLVERGVPHEFYRLGRPLRRLEEAAALLELPARQVAAVELFDARPLTVAAVLPADACPSAVAVARAAGARRARALPRARVVERTGFLPEWLPPVGHAEPSLTVVDPALLGADVVYAAGGDPGVMLVIRAADLVRATAAVVAPLLGPGEPEETDEASARGPAGGAPA
jgi:Cys-tRNA(Pro)/Cys-tRNA(Cys) deacylase